MSIPEISEIDNIDDMLKFNIHNVDVSIVNGLRRTILSNIETLVFKGTNDSITIHKNTTKFNNEYMKHRLMNIPIFINDVSKFDSIVNKYIVEVNETNETLEKKYITTEHFKIKNKDTEEYLPKSEVEKIFPRDPMTNEFILLTILYPNYNKKNEPNETLHFESNIDKGTSNENSCWNVVHNVCYENYRDIDKISQIMSSMGEQSPQEKRDFEILDAQRIYIPNKFIMRLQSLGIFSNNELIVKACDIIMYKLNKINEYVSGNSKLLTKDEVRFNETNGTSTQEEVEQLRQQYCNLYIDDEFRVFELKDDDYTIGKIIEKHFNLMYGKNLDYIGFKKEHPTRKEAYIYLKYKSDVSAENIYEDFKNMIALLMKTFQTIQSKF